MFTHVGAAAQATRRQIDTHWIWREGDCRLTKIPLQIENGKIAVPDAPGSGIPSWTGRGCKSPSSLSGAAGGARNDAGADAVSDPRLEFDRKRPVFGHTAVANQ